MSSISPAEGRSIAQDYLTPSQAAMRLRRSYSHIMHMLERGEMSGVKLFDRWLLTMDDLVAYRERRYGALRDLAQTALAHPHIRLTARQHAICEALADEQTCSDVARVLGITRQAVHAQISLIRRKVEAQ